MAKIQCSKLKKELEPLSKAPWPGELGQRILKEISQQAWQLWLSHQTMLINEYRLTPIDPKDRKYLQQEMEKFLFGSEEEASTPPDYVPPTSDN
ncbi:MAG: oxidative damage protection protein [Candidatus Porifericomitaceae bacterium WSBS_2022_MAG_OTU9]